MSFTIDKTAPTITLNGVTDGGYTNSASVVATIKEKNISSCYYVLNSNKTNYTSGTPLTGKGVYDLTVIDKVGFSVTVTFTIDRTAPTIRLTGATNGGYTKTDVSVTISDDYSALANL